MASVEITFQLKTKWQEETSLGKIRAKSFPREENQVQRLSGRSKHLCIS